MPAVWPTDSQLSGNAFLPQGLLQLQADTVNSPVALWLDKGKALWADGTAGGKTEGKTGPSCQSCHGDIARLKKSAATFPRLHPNGQSVVNLEDQLLRCSARVGRPNARAEDDEVLALSAVLHDIAKGERIDVRASTRAFSVAPMAVLSASAAVPATPQPTPQTEAQLQAQFQTHVARGAQQFATRLGRINLACVQCHEQNVGKQMRADVVSPGHPTGFPIYRMSWQRIGTLERRLRACYSGVQAVLPPPGDPVLRDLELYLKVRANGMPLEGPSIRR